MKKDDQMPSDSEASEKGHGLQNILKLILLVAVLVGAWFLLDWLITVK